ncbi:hypothetical protein BC830DRAFT_1224446 [Chytriomyces sp. MP71]|nr:hypothetical protein BC830DRAFT_1224446 [Chytriomyces sp. MP71]
MSCRKSRGGGHTLVVSKPPKSIDCANFASSESSSSSAIASSFSLTSSLSAFLLAERGWGGGESVRARLLLSLPRRPSSRSRPRRSTTLSLPLPAVLARAAPAPIRSSLAVALSGVRRSTARTLPMRAVAIPLAMVAVAQPLAVVSVAPAAVVVPVIVAVVVSVAAALPRAAGNNRREWDQPTDG